MHPSLFIRPGRGQRQRSTRALVAAGVLALVASGCSAADGEQARASAVTSSGLQQFTSGGAERAYYVDLPDGYDPDGEPLPLVLALHGTGGSYAKWLDDTYNLSAAVADEAVMVYPEALPSAAGTNQWVIERDMPYIADVLDRLGDQVAFDPERILVTGQSSGAGMSHEIGCRFGDRVRAVAPAAGVLTATQCTGSVAVIQVQGTSDPVVPFGLAQQTSQFWARYNGLGPNAVAEGTHPSCQQYPGPDGTVDADNLHPVHLCTHNEGSGEGRKGHAWPSIAGEAIWQTFTSLPRAKNSSAKNSSRAPAGGGNEKVLADADTTATFTVRFPEELPSTPVQGAVVAYAPGEVTPTTAPLAFMTMQFAPGTVVPGEERTYTVPVSYTEFGGEGGFSVPGTFTIMVTMHTEDGGYPIPVPGVDLWTMHEYEFTDKDTPVKISGVLDLEPIPGSTGL